MDMAKFSIRLARNYFLKIQIAVNFLSEGGIKMKRVIFSVFSAGAMILLSGRSSYAVPPIELPEPNTFILIGAGLAVYRIIRRPKK
jgi:hypothetical protein